MSSLTKYQGEMKSTLNLIIINKIKNLDLIDKLIDLKIIIEEAEKISNH